MDGHVLAEGDLCSVVKVLAKLTKMITFTVRGGQQGQNGEELKKICIYYGASLTCLTLFFEDDTLKMPTVLSP